MKCTSSSIAQRFFISALQGRNIEKIFPLIKDLHTRLNQRVPTPALNRFIETAMHRTHPPMINGKRLRIYYLTQIDTCPPRLLLFINYKNRLSADYQRYLINQFRKKFRV